MNDPVESATPQKPVSPAPTVSDFWCRRSTRLLLLLLHLVLLIAALSLTPGAHAFELGEVSGSIVILGCLFSWVVLYHAHSRPLVAIFAGIGIVQIAFITVIGLQFRSEDKALQAVSADAVRLREQDAAAMAPFSMDPLFEMCSGGRPLNLRELAELCSRAQRGRAKLQELESAHKQWLEQTERRLRAVGPAVAREFHQGVASSQTESDEIMKINQDLFSQAEQLAAFLIDHQHRYHTTSAGIVFNKTEDQEAFDHEIESISQLQAGLQSRAQKVEERFQEVQH